MSFPILPILLESIDEKIPNRLVALKFIEDASLREPGKESRKTALRSEIEILTLLKNEQLQDYTLEFIELVRY